MSPSPTSIPSMPSENSFKKQAEVAREALKNFNMVRALNAPSLVKAALTDLVESTVRFPISFSVELLISFFFQAAFNNFVPFFVNHSLFQEIPPAVHSVIEDFRLKNPHYDMPSLTLKVAGLAARVKDSLAASLTKKGPILAVLFIFSSSSFLSAYYSRWSSFR